MAEPPQMDEPTPTSVEILPGIVQDTAQDEGDNERNRDGGDDNGQGLGTDVGDIGQVQSESEQDHRVLQDLLRCVLDTGRGCFRDVGTAPQAYGQHHADDDSEYRSTDNLELLAEKPRRNRDRQREAPCYATGP